MWTLMWTLKAPGPAPAPRLHMIVTNKTKNKPFSLSQCPLVRSVEYCVWGLCQCRVWYLRTSEISKVS